MKRFAHRYTDALWAPNALRPNELLVALAYAKYAGAKDYRSKEKADEDVSWVAWPTLSDLTGIRSKDALSRATKGLISGGWLVPIEARRHHRSPRYRLAIPDDPEVRGTYRADDE